MVEAATEFRKNSFNDSDSATLAKVATMFQNVSDESISASESASFIIAQMKAFGIEAGNAEHIIDAVNAVSNNYAVSSGQLAKTLGNMSAALSVGNNSFEESLGLLTAGTEVTRNASKVSRALVSIQSRLNQVIDESSSTGQALTEWYKKHNIAILDQQGQLRSLYDVLTDVAEIWPELTKNEQAYYLNQQAGANQSQNLAAILSNFDTAAKATATAVNSAGSAMKENEAYAESLDFQTNVLKADFQDLANNVIDKQLISALLTLGDAFLKAANTGLGTFITKVGLLAGTGWGLSSLLKVSNILPTIATQFSNFGAVISLVAEGSGTFGAAIGAAGGAASVALPIFLAVSAAIVGIVELANALEENAHKAEKELEDLQTQIKEMEDPSSEYSDLKSRVDELTDSELVRLGVLQSQLDTLKEQEEVLSRQQLAKWQKGQVEDQTTYVTNYDDYGYGITEAYTYNQAADSLKNLREEYYNLQKEKEQGAVSDVAYITRLQSIIDKNQDTTANLRALKTAYEETGDATYKLNTDQERFLRLIDAASTQIADNASKVADTVKAEQDAAYGLEDAMSQVEVATYDTSTAAAQLTASLFDQNGQLTEAAQTALSVDGSMASLAQSELQAQQAAAQANYANLVLEIQKVGSAAMITAGQLSQMMALAGVSFGTADSDTFLKMRYRQTAGETAEANPEGYNKFVTDYLSKRAKANYEKTMKETQEKLDQLQKKFPTGTGGGGSSRKSAEEKAAEEAEKQAKKAQKAQEKAAKQSQQAYESAAKSAEQAAQEASRAAEQAAEEAKQKILDSIQELKDVSDDFWDSKTDAIEETNKELDRQKQLEEKLKALEEAKQKKIILYKNGQFQYDKDYGTIAKAKADYEETRDKIQRERELEQLEEMKDNATEIFNEMKDIVQNGGDVTQTMINNWLSKMQSDGANYYDSNKAILSDWLAWAQGAIKEFSQSALESIGGGYTSTSGKYGSNATAGGGLLESILEYQQNPKYWRNGEFIGMGAAMWTDLFEAQLASGYFGDYTTMPESIGKLPGSSVFDDWQKAFEYWARDSMQSVDALEDMIDRLVAAKGVLDRHKDEFKSLGRDDLYQKALDIQDIDEDKLFRYAKLYGAVQNPDMPFGFSPYLREDEFKNLDPDQKLAALLPMIRDYEYWTGSRTAEGEHQEWFQGRMGSKDYTLGKDYGRLTYTGDIVRTAKTYTDEGKKIYMFTDAGGDYYVDRTKTYFDQKKLAQWYEENERAISEIQEKLWEIPGDELLQKALEQELERRRQARVYSADVLGYDTEAAEAQSEYERERQSSVGYVEVKRQRKTDENLFKIQDALDRLDRGNQVSDKYLSNASDYIGKVIEENAQKILDANSDAEKKALEAQNAQLELMRQQVEEGKTGQRTENVYEWEDAEFEDYDPTEDVARMLRELQQAMQENSKAWWDADEETRKQLHESNIRLAKQIEDLSNTRMTYEGHTGVWTQTARNATGTHNFRGGLSLVGENGPELRVLRRGDNIIPANQTANLWKWSNTTPQQMLTTLSARSGGSNTSYTFDVSRIELPNVTDAKSFVQGLKNYALQYSYKR